jgi:hypothetical protein
VDAAGDSLRAPLRPRGVTAGHEGLLARRRGSTICCSGTCVQWGTIGRGLVPGGGLKPESARPLQQLAPAREAPHSYRHPLPSAALKPTSCAVLGRSCAPQGSFRAPSVAGSRLSQRARPIRFTLRFVSAAGDAVSASRADAVLEIRSGGDIVWVRQDRRSTSMAAGHSGLARGGRRLSCRKAGGQVTAGFLWPTHLGRRHEPSERWRLCGCGSSTQPIPSQQQWPSSSASMTTANTHRELKSHLSRKRSAAGFLDGADGHHSSSSGARDMSACSQGLSAPEMADEVLARDP